MRLLEKNQDKINWDNLSENPSEGAMRLLEKNPDKINLSKLSGNLSEHAMQLLENNRNKRRHCVSPEFMVIGTNPNKIYWYDLSKNPRIFNYDYKQMKHNCMLFKEDLMKNRFHPCNILKFRDWGVNGFESVFY